MNRVIVSIRFYFFLILLLIVFNSCNLQEIQLLRDDTQALRVVAQSGHSFGICAIAVSSDNKYAATGSFDGSVKIWDIESGMELKTFNGHSVMIKSIGFSYDQSKLISGDGNGVVILWDINTGHILEQDQLILPVVSVALDSSNSFKFLKILIDSVYRNTDSLYENGGYGYYFRFNGGRISISQDLQYAATYIKEKGKLMLWNLQTFQKTDIPITKYGFYSPTISFSSDSKNLGYTNGYEKIFILNLSTKRISSAQMNYRQLDSVKTNFTICGLWLNNDKSNIITCEQAFGKGDFYSWICVRETKHGRIVKTVDFGNTLISASSFFNDGKYLLIGSSDNLISLWDVESGVHIRTFGQTNLVYRPNIEFSLNGNALLISGFGATAVWEKSTGRIKRTIEHQHKKTEKNPMGVMIAKEEIYLSFMGKYIYQKRKNEDYQILEVQTGKPCNTVRRLGGNFRFCFFSKDDRFIFGISKDSIFRKWDIKSGECLDSTEQLPSLRQSIMPIKNNTMFYSMIPGDSIISLWETNPLKKIRTINKRRKNIPIVSPNGTIYIDYPTYKVVIRDMISDSLINIIDFSTSAKKTSMNINDFAISYDDKYFIYVVNQFEIFIWDIVSGKLIKKIQTQENSVFSIAVSPDSKQILSSNGDGTSKLWDINTGNLIATYVVGGKDIYAIILPDNYYSASKNASAIVHFVQNLQYYTFENFDLKFNRPDIVAQRLGCSDTALVMGLQHAYEKRLQKLSYQASDVTNSLDIPIIEIDKSAIPLTTSDDTIRIIVKTTDEKSNLDRINIYDNNVSLFGTSGYSLRKENTHTFEKIFSVPLSIGNNNIKISSTNISGGESIFQTVNVVKSNTKNIRPHLYLVSIGVSSFTNSEFNLSYAAKDARDMASMFKKNPSFSGISIFSITDSMATKEYILQCKDSLRKSLVGDVVIVFVATHGLFDNDLNYFLGTSDINFSQPSLRGLSYGSLESLFDGIPARNRLLLIDACHSGEIDKEESELVADNAISIDGVTSRGFKKIIDKKQTLGLQNSFSLMQELFTDLNKGTGANVISSASGKEYAYESGEWNNGVFTYSILEGITSFSADLNIDGKITVSELQEYVTQKVQSLTNGKQTPTSRRENVENDFRVW